MPKSKQYYDPHEGVAMLRNWIDTLKEKTGRDLDEWTALIKAKGPADIKSRRAWLKEKHSLSDELCRVACRRVRREVVRRAYELDGN